MTYLVFCTFDLREARREDHLYLYVDLAKLGLKKTVASDDGRNFTIPATAVMGMLEGNSINEVRTTVVRNVEQIFKTHGYNGEFFVVVSADWACGGASY